MFQVSEGKWCQIQNNFTENVRDAVGAAVNEGLFQSGRRDIEALEHQYMESERYKYSINAKLEELRSIV